MARPLVLVFEELAQPQATPAIPDLNTIVIGPAYDVLDFPDDAATILLTSTYGSLNLGNGYGSNVGYAPPVTGAAAVTVLSGAYPGQHPGALVDHATVRLTLKLPRVVLGSTYLGSGVAPVLAAKVTTDVTDQTLVTITAAVTNTFVQLGVRAGDTIVLTSSYATTEQTVVRTVASVGEPNPAGLVPAGSESKLRLTQNLPPANTAATGTITAVGGASLVDGETFTISDGTNVATVFEFDSGGGVVGGHVAVAFTGGDSAATVAASILAAINGVGGGLLVTASSGGGALVNLVNDVVGAQGNVALAETVANAGFVVSGMTGGLADATTWTYDTNGEARVERVLTTQTLVDTTGTFVTFPEPGTDKLVLLGAVQLSLSLTPAATVAVPNPATATVSRTLSYAEVYLAYRALRQDLQEVGSVTTENERTSNGLAFLDPVGKIDARNPLAGALHVALQNSGAAPVFYYGVSADSAVGHASARAGIETRDDLYALVLLTSDLNVLAGYKFEVESLADPLLAQQDGVPQKFRMALGSTTLPTTTTIYAGSLNGVASQPSGAVTGLYRTLSFLNASALNFHQVLPGDTLTIGLTPVGTQWQNRRGVHVVGHVNSSDPDPAGGVASVLELVPGNGRWNDLADAGSTGDIEVLIKGADGTTKVSKLAAADLTINAGTVHIVMKAPTQQGGPYTVAYLVSAPITSPTVAINGFAITVTVNGTSHTTQNVSDALNAHATVGALLTATVTAGAGAIVNAPLAPVSVSPVATSATATVLVNDGLYNKLTDAAGLFLTAGTKPGDLVEIPLDPNNYGPDAYVGRTLTYVVAQVLSESALLIANGLDDTGSSANELPHFFARDVANRFVDNTALNAQNYRVRRALSKDDQVLALAGVAQSLKSKRVVVVFPDLVTVAGLLDGGLPRTLATTPSPANDQPGWYLAAQVGGAIAGLPAQHPLTNLGLAGVSSLKHAQGYFSERQLTRLSDAGLFVMKQNHPTDLPYCIHQLTTDPSFIETGEVSVVKNIDFVAKFLQDLLGLFLGQYNVLPETLNNIHRSVSDGMDLLIGRRIDKIGPPLLSGTITLIRVSPFAADRVQLFTTISVPKPLNTIELHVVSS